MVNARMIVGIFIVLFAFCIAWNVNGIHNFNSYPCHERCMIMMCGEGAPTWQFTVLHGVGGLHNIACDSTTFNAEKNMTWAQEDCVGYCNDPNIKTTVDYVNGKMVVTCAALIICVLLFVVCGKTKRGKKK